MPPPARCLRVREVKGQGRIGSNSICLINVQYCFVRVFYGALY